MDWDNIDLFESWPFPLLRGSTSPGLTSPFSPSGDQRNNATSEQSLFPRWMCDHLPNFPSPIAHGCCHIHSVERRGQTRGPEEAIKVCDTRLAAHLPSPWPSRHFRKEQIETFAAVRVRRPQGFPLQGRAGRRSALADLTHLAGRGMWKGPLILLLFITHLLMHVQTRTTKTERTCTRPGVLACAALNTQNPIHVGVISRSLGGFIRDSVLVATVARTLSCPVRSANSIPKN